MTRVVNPTLPGGSNAQFQYNNNGVFGGAAGFTWDGDVHLADNIKQYYGTDDDFSLEYVSADNRLALTHTGGFLFLDNVTLDLNRAAAFGSTYWMRFYHDSITPNADEDERVGQITSGSSTADGTPRGFAFVGHTGTTSNSAFTIFGRVDDDGTGDAAVVQIDGRKAASAGSVWDSGAGSVLSNRKILRVSNFNTAILDIAPGVSTFTGQIVQNETLDSSSAGFALTHTISNTGSTQRNGILLTVQSGSSTGVISGLAFDVTATTSDTTYTDDTSVFGYRPGGKRGAGGFSRSVDSGVHTGGMFIAGGSNSENYGSWNAATVTRTGGQNIGVLGVAENVAGTEFGGAFVLESKSSQPVTRSTSAALLCDNSTLDEDIFVALHNGTDTFLIDNNGFARYLTASGITASTTQTQGNGALTAQLNEVSTVANVNDTVTLPAAQTGMWIVIINNGANTLQIFPASGDDLGAGTDTATTLASGKNIKFHAYDSTNWEQMYVTP